MTTTTTTTTMKTFFIKLYGNKKILYFILLVLVWLLIYIAFFGRNGSLLFGDSNPAFSKSQFLYTWFSKNLGFDYSSYLSTLPYLVLSHLFINVFGLNIGTKMCFLLPLLYFSSIVYWITCYCGLKIRNCFILSVLALINPLTLGYILVGGVAVTFMGFSNITLALFFFYLALNHSRALINKYFILSIIFASFTSFVVYFFMFFVLFVVFFVSELFFTKNKIKLFKSTIVHISLVVVVNFYWLVPFVYSLIFLHGQATILPSNSGVSVLNSLAPFAKILNAFSMYYYGSLQDWLHFGVFLDVSLITLVVIIIYLLFCNKNFPSKEHLVGRKITLLVLMMFLVSIFFATGSNAPFGGLFLWLFNNFPLFQGFRTFMRFNVVIFICYIAFLALVFNRIKNRVKTETSLIVFLIVLMLYFGQHFVYLKNNNIYPMQLPSSYYKLLLNNNKLDFNSIDTPFFTYNYKYTWGETSLITHLFERYFWYGYIGYIKADSVNHNLIDLYNNLGNPKYFNDQYFINLNAIANLKNIITHKDKVYSNETAGDIFPFKSIEDIFRNKLAILVEDNDYFLHFVIPASYYLPHFYTPKSIILSSGNIDMLPDIISSPNYGLRSAIYFQDQNKDMQLSYKQPTKLPILEFKRINPTKYRIVVHNASDEFPLIFSESFNDGWKSYLVNYKKSTLDFNEADYRVLDNNEGNQATAQELTSFIDTGYISSLGDLKEKNIKHMKWENSREVFGYNEKYKIDFISKNFQDTIQNDNLENGSFYETWFKSSVDDNKNHVEVNGYANSWIVDPNKLCDSNSKCVKNSDGSYDLELVVEFWPQRLFYVGSFISMFSLFVCVGYLIRVGLINRFTNRHK